MITASLLHLYWKLKVFERTSLTRATIVALAPRDHAHVPG